MRQALVVSEVALAVVLVIGAGLLIKSFARLQQVDVGFDPTNVLAVQVELPESRYGDATKRLQFFERLQAQVAALPGVRQVSVALEHPLSPGWTSSFTIAEHERPREGEEPESRIRPVTAGYFRTVGLPLRRGRDLSERDVVGAPGVVVINEAFARVHFPNEDPIGKHIERSAWWPGMPDRFEIVGVVADEKFLGLQAGADPATYFHLPQFALAQYLVIRATGDPLALVPVVREQVWSIDRSLPVENVTTMDAAIDEQLAGARFNATLIGIFAAVALALAALGVYGVLSYTVTQRTNEIGIRMALGAQRGSVARLVVGHGMALTAAGIGLGLVASVWLTRSISRLLFDVSRLDPAVFAVVALLLGAVAFAAAYLPARRASRVDPMVALRGE
jgi:putative ABC transport system permease protein